MPEPLADQASATQKLNISATHILRIADCTEETSVPISNIEDP